MTIQTLHHTPWILKTHISSGHRKFLPFFAIAYRQDMFPLRIKYNLFLTFTPMILQRCMVTIQTLHHTPWILKTHISSGHRKFLTFLGIGKTCFHYVSSAIFFDIRHSCALSYISKVCTVLLHCKFMLSLLSEFTK